MPKIGRFTALVIVFAIKTGFFNEVNSYNLNWKPYTSRFFSLFYREIIRIIYFMLFVVIKDLTLCMNNKNLMLEKSGIQLKSYIQKSEKNEYFILFSLLKQPNIN